jgi:non-specific serine/threonine protein kinase
VLALCRRSAEAIAQFDTMKQRCPGQFFTDLGSFLAAALGQNAEAAAAYATPALRELVAADPHYSWAMAEGYAVLGDAEEALVWLENAMAKGFLNYPMVKTWDPLLGSVRRDSRFLHLLQSMRERWENFEV